MGTEPASLKNSDLQVLRAVAVLAVVLHHVPGYLLPETTPGLASFYAYFGGSVGVDLFLVISGFIISRRLIPEVMGQPSAAFWPVVAHFWARRAVRLLPAAWLWLALTLGLTLGFNASGAFGAFSVNLSWAGKALLQVANLQHVWVLNDASFGALPHYWSLSLEEQFYLALPLLLWVSGPRLPLVLTGLMLLQCLPLPGWDWYWWAFRLMPLLLGVLLGLGHERGWMAPLQPQFLVTRRGWGPAALGLVGVCLLTLTGQATRFVSIQQAYLVAAWASFVLVWLASYDLKLFSVTPWLERLAVGLGDRSYALYLCHIAAFFTAREVLFRWGGAMVPGTGEYALACGALAVVCLVVFTEATHRGVELRWQRAWAPALADLGARKRLATEPARVA